MRGISWTKKFLPQHYIREKKKRNEKIRRESVTEVVILWNTIKAAECSSRSTAMRVRATGKQNTFHPLKAFIHQFQYVAHALRELIGRIKKALVFASGMASSTAMRRLCGICLFLSGKFDVFS